MITVLNPEKKYNLEYYMNCVDKIVGMGAHILGKSFSRLKLLMKVIVPRTISAAKLYLQPG